ncbi:MAG TPA: cation:proton antiporter [Rhodanobacteraceae bacterium]|nr:cation:proton antiporter [Rhodanobacteraceae bacterium]
MHGLGFIRDLAFVMLGAGVITVLFHRLRLPVLLGYIIAGVLIGPHTPWKLVTDERTMRDISDLGVLLLMFTLGLEFSLRKLRALGARVLLAGITEVGLMLWLGIEAARLAGWSPRAALFLGGVVCFSSTMVVVRNIESRGLKREPFVPLLIGVLISEEVLTVLLLTILSVVAAGGEVAPDAALGVIGRMAVFIVAAVIAGLLLLPKLLDAIAAFGREEMLLVAALGICFGASLLAEDSGFSIALGAFLAGVVVAEAHCAPRITRLVQPVRDMFAAIFFVAIGLLLDPVALWHVALPALGLALLVIFGKVFASGAGVFLFGGAGAGRALRIGLNMAQIGEFSFVIASLGIAGGAVGTELYPLAVGAAVVCMAVSPLLTGAAPGIERGLRATAPRWLQALAGGYTEWLAQLQPGGDNLVIARMLRRLLWHIGVNVLLVCAVFAGGAWLEHAIPRYWPQWSMDDVTRRSLIWAGALFVSLPMLVATYRKADALGMLLSELGIRESVYGGSTQALRRVFSKLIPLSTLFGLAVLVAVLGAAILPPRGVLLALLAIGAITAWFLWSALVRLHARMQASLRDLVEKPDEGK